MKISVIIATIFSLTVAMSAGESLAEERMKRYSVESGIVEYTLTGTQNGTEILYFDDWGMREAKYSDTEITMMGIVEKKNQLLIMDGDWQYWVDLRTRTGIKFQNSAMKEIVEQSEDKDLTEIGEKMLKNRGGKKIGTEEIAGKKCDIWEIEKMYTRTWIWKGIALKNVVDMAGMKTVSIATRMEENAKIPEGKLSIPDDVKIAEDPDFNNLLESLDKKKGSSKMK